jgi:translation initiation factor 2B subunit (eIF-2B alpha/beta/delta family)
MGSTGSTDIVARARRVAGDRDAGASEILQGLLPILEEALAAGPDAVRAIVDAVTAVQPGMAPIWNACAATLAGVTNPARFERFRDEAGRAPRAVARVAGRAILELLEASTTPGIATFSYSATVVAAIAEVAAARVVTVICGEGRPRCEGRRMAESLARVGATVVLTTDAGVTRYLDRVGVVVVGADALLSDRWINKVGTRTLAASASLVGIPVVVAAGREKALAPALESRFRLADGPADEVWPDPPAGIEVASPVFEAIPAELATWFATDAGLLTAADLPALADRFASDVRLLVESGRV